MRQNDLNIIGADVAPQRYLLTEYNSEGYSGRTRANVQDSEPTLFIVKGKLTPGTKLTLKFAKQLRKQYFILNLSEKLARPDLARGWIVANAISRLNVAGTSASKWLWTYNNERPKMGIGDITPGQRLRTAALPCFSKRG